MKMGGRETEKEGGDGGEGGVMTGTGWRGGTNVEGGDWKGSGGRLGGEETSGTGGRRGVTGFGGMIDGGFSGFGGRRVFLSSKELSFLRCKEADLCCDPGRRGGSVGRGKSGRSGRIGRGLSGTGSWIGGGNLVSGKRGFDPRRLIGFWLQISGWFSGLKVKNPAEKTRVFSPCLLGLLRRLREEEEVAEAAMEQ